MIFFLNPNVDLKQNGLVMTEELKEQLEDAAAATSKAYAHVRTLGTTEAASESDILNLGQGTLHALIIIGKTITIVYCNKCKLL